jgi:hypothetical protein
MPVPERDEAAAGSRVGVLGGAESDGRTVVVTRRRASSTVGAGVTLRSRNRWRSAFVPRDAIEVPTGVGPSVRSAGKRAPVSQCSALDEGAMSGIAWMR